MKIAELVRQYIESRWAIGMKFIAQGITLRSFARAVGDVDAADVSPADVRRFLDGKDNITTFWHQKASTLRGLFRFALARGYVGGDPMPVFEPVKPDYMKPYIYSTADIRRLLAAADVLAEHKKFTLNPPLFRSLLLLLYGAGLRLGEALALTVGDVDLDERLLTIRNTKFFKTRMVAIGPKLAGILTDYLRRHRPPSTTDAFFVSRRGRGVSRQTAERAFRWTRSRAAVHREPDARYQPRLHDLRHTFAVHRLISWYRQGADLTHRLHRLSVHLGHASLSDTQPYLSATPELFAQAVKRFQNYAFPEVHRD